MSVLDRLRETANKVDDEDINKPISLLDKLRETANNTETRDPIAKMNDNIQLKERLAYEEEQKLESEEEPTFGSETYRALVGGTRDAAQGVLNLQDYLTDKLAEET